MRNMHRVLVASTFAVLFLLVSFTIAQTWSPEMHVKTKIVGSPDISPDGSRIVYTVNDAVMTADRSEFVTQIWLATADGRENLQLTFGEKSSANPKFSPDGTMIAFTSNRKDNKNQIYVLRLAGGEAEQITDGKGAVSNFKWSPDGRSIAFTMTDPKSEDEDKNDKGRNDFRWVEESVKMAKLYITPLQKGTDGKREVRKLTDLDRHVTSFDWAPSGNTIAFSHVKSPLVDHWPTADVSLADVASGRISGFAGSEAAEESPIYSPDGRSLAISVSVLPTRWAQSERIAVYPAGGGEPKLMDASYDGAPNVIGWTKDNKQIYFYEPHGTGTALYVADVATGKVTATNHSRAQVSAPAMTADGRTFAFAMQTADRPQELFVARQGDTEPLQLSKANADQAKHSVGRAEVIKWKSKDGREIEGLLYYPTGYKSGQKVPLILNIHGGPAGVFQNGYVGGRGAYPLATMMEKGFAVLRPNPRGSSGYGVEFRRANIKDWGFGDYEDLMTGVDHVIGMGVADPERLGVMGWSYGGYMTSMIITKTNRFKAASAGAPVTNMMSFNGTADIPSFIPDYFESEFWDDPAIYAKHSAMFNIKNAKTPTLIQHGENDLRVPISQGYELFNALRRQGVPTRMIVFPRQPHGIQEPRLLIATMQSNVDWFEKYLK